ncbi:MAG: glycosyltransferase [Acidobacteriota bacterium]
MPEDDRTVAAVAGPQLSVVIPTHHEEGNIEPLLSKVKAVLDTLGATYEIVIVDVGSGDATIGRAQAMGARAFVQGEPGYGGALRDGFRLALGEFVVTMDADLSHDPVFIKDMWARRNDADMIIASRYVDGGKAEMPLFRYVLSRILNVTWSFILSLPLKDISSGFRMYRRRILPGLKLGSRDFDILEEIVLKVYAEGYRVLEIPLAYAPRQSGRSHARLFGFAKSYARTLFSMWRLRNSLFSADYDERAFNSWIPPQRYWQRERYRIIMRMLAGTKGTTLDIGCGSSRIVQAMPKAVGLDILLKKLRYLRKMGKPLVTGDINQLPFATATFDTVVCSQVIEHIPIDIRIFRELARVTREAAS